MVMSNRCCTTHVLPPHDFSPSNKILLQFHPVDKRTHYTISGATLPVFCYCSMIILLQTGDLRSLVVTHKENIEKLLPHCRAVGERGTSSV